jgi:hypothetical protein
MSIQLLQITPDGHLADAQLMRQAHDRGLPIGLDEVANPVEPLLA